VDCFAFLGHPNDNERRLTGQQFERLCQLLIQRRKQKTSGEITTMKNDDTQTGDTTIATKPKAERKAASQKNGIANAALPSGEFIPKNESTVQRVTHAGAIRIENEKALQAVPIYYEARGQWYCADGRGCYAKITDSQAKSFVAEYGFNKNAKDGQGNTPAERAMLWLMQNHRVAFAGALAGYPAGVHESGGIRFLVTESPAFVEPKPGKCDKIRLLVESLLFESTAAESEQRRQIDYFYIWASESYAAYYRRLKEGETDKFRHCPALVIFGPRLCGKSVLIDLILTPLFGGKKADPMSFLRDAKFNKELFGASILAADDTGSSSNLAERRERGEGIKKLLWNAEQRMEGKGADAVNLRPFWRMVMASNDDHAGLQVCPALSPSLEDKLLIFHAQKAEGLPQTHEERDTWADAMRAELPAFAAFLLAYRPPENVVLDPRTRVAIFQHPKIVAELRELQPEMRLLELIDTLGLISDEAPLWEGRAAEFEKEMRAKDGEGLLDRIFSGAGTTGKMLTELERVAPARVNVTKRNGGSYYKIFRAT